MAGFTAAVIVALEASWLLAIVSGINFPILFLAGSIQVILLKIGTDKNKQLMEESGRTTSEAINNIRTVASLGMEERFCRHYQEQLIPPFK